MNLQETIAAARAGNASALEDLSLTALGETGDSLLARAAILEIDSLPWPPVQAKFTGVKAIVWSADIEQGKRGPHLGDVPQHNEV